MKILAISLDNTDYEKSRSLEIYLMEFIAKQGHEVTVLCERELYYDESDPKPENFSYHVMSVNESRFGDPEKWWEENQKSLMFGKVDIVFGSSVTGANLGRFLANLYKCPFICQLLDVPFFRFKYPEYKKEWEIYLEQLIHADQIIVNTEPCKRILHELYNGKQDSKITKIYYGMSCDIADRIPDQEKIYDMVVVTRIVSHKCPEKLAFLLAKLRYLGYRDLKVALIGMGPSSEAIRLLDLLDFTGQLQNVKIFSPCDDVTKFKIIKQSRMMYVTDICETIGSLVSAEGLYCKIPVVCSDMLINRERLLNWCTYVKPLDIEGAVDVTMKILDGGFQIEEGFYDRASQWIKENRSYQKQAEETLEIFKNILIRQNPG